MKFIVGLGNPGSEYKMTKHNMGFEVVLRLAKDNKIKIDREKHFSLMGEGRIGGEDVTLILPQTYMNLSGKTVGELYEHEIKRIEDLVVICDDINMELGKVRLRKQGSAGGHKGLESIMHIIQRDDFARLRVGIATEAHKGDITDYVLSPFKRKEVRNALHTIRLAAECAECIVEEGVAEAMTKFNKRRVGTS